MSHLNLNQTTSSIEVVSSSIIDKLYELAQNPSLDTNSTIQGNLQCTHAYEDTVTYLLNKFPGLQINVTQGAYIRFADSAVAAICASNWGDGNGITTVQASVVASLNSKFTANTSIVSFNELAKFINVKTLVNNEFTDCSKLQSIDLANITTLGGGAFKNCTALVNVLNLNDAITKFTFYVFNTCSNLVNIHIPTSCTIVELYAFYNCAKLVITDSLENIVTLGSFCFRGCTALTILAFSNNLKTIGDYSFQEDTNLTSIGDTSGVTNVGSGSFDRSGIISQDFSACTIINSYAFRSCAKLESVILSSVCTSIGQYSFSDCIKLVSLGDTSGVVTIGAYAFSNCKLLSQVLDLSNVTSIGSNAFQTCSKLLSTNISNKCTSIGTVGFRDCVLLTTIGDTTGLTTVSDYCFYGCTLLDKFELGVNCTSIGNNSFTNCTHLRYLKINGTSVVLNYISALTNTTCKIYVPDDSVASYKAATNWSTYASRIFSLTQFAIDFPNG